MENTLSKEELQMILSYRSKNSKQKQQFLDNLDSSDNESHQTQPIDIVFLFASPLVDENNTVVPEIEYTKEF